MRNEVEQFFSTRGWEPLPFQREVWHAYLAGESGLVHAATGTGKTYAVWLGVLMEALARGEQRTATKRAKRSAAPPLRVLWITPLRALASDTEAALREPLDAFNLSWTLESRTGDTSASRRARQREQLPTTLITTPESLTLLFTRDDAASLFRDLELIVVDEWHELLGSKRGVLVELALARLRNWQPNLRTWGLSATLGNLDVARNALLGTQPAPSRVVQGTTPKEIVIDSIIPAVIERFPWAGHLGTRLVREVIDVIEANRTTLLFTNTRSQTELWFQAIVTTRPELEGQVGLHHGSLSRELRTAVEERLKNGTIRCVVCTSSLDLGVDFSPVDRVLQVGSPKGIARLLQRAGRSGHDPARTSRITCVPTHAFELIEVAAARTAASRGRIESRTPPRAPLDLLAQHLVTCAMGGGFVEADLLAEVRTADAYRTLSDIEWQWTIDFVAHGGAALKAYDEYRKIVRDESGAWRVADRRVAMRHRMSVGTIVSDAAVSLQFLKGGRIGTVEESFVARLRKGDQFIFAGRGLEFVRVRDMVAWVRLAKGARGVSRWMGARMSLSSELAAAVRDKLTDARDGIFEDPEMIAVRELLALQAEWSVIPERDALLIERLRTREGYHLFCYTFAGRLVHEGLAALVAWRIGRMSPASFSIAVSDYGFELLSPLPIAIDEEKAAALFSIDNLTDDILASINASEMARRQFREIARITGLIFQGYPGSNKTVRQVQASSGLLFDVFQRHDPENLLLHQAYREVLERQLEESRLVETLHEVSSHPIELRDITQPTPMAFPLMYERFRSGLSTEKLADRVRRMTLALEKKAS